MLITEHQISEKELQLQQKNKEIQSLQKELELSRSELNHLQGQLASERKKTEKQILSLKEAMKMQRTQLERELRVSPDWMGGILEVFGDFFWQNDKKAPFIAGRTKVMHYNFMTRQNLRQTNSGISRLCCRIPL